MCGGLPGRPHRRRRVLAALRRPSAGGQPARDCMNAAWACSRTVRHEVTSERRRSSALRSRSVMPPHTPNSMRLSRASARHSVRTAHPPHTALARFCWALWANSSSGSLSRHAALPIHWVLATTGLSLHAEQGLCRACRAWFPGASRGSQASVCRGPRGGVPCIAVTQATTHRTVKRSPLYRPIWRG